MTGVAERLYSAQATLCFRLSEQEGSVTSVAIDLGHRHFNPTGNGKFRVTFLDRATVEKITERFIEGATCIVRHSGRTYVAVEITDALEGRYNLTVAESKLGLIAPTAPET